MGIPINNISPRVQYTATNLQTVFNIPFPFFVNSDISVYQTPAGTVGSDASSILVFATNYTLTGAGSATGGNMTLNVGANLNDIITIVRTMPEQRTNLYISGGLFTADMVNNDFSMDVMMDQQNQMQTQLLTPHYQYSSLAAAGVDTWLALLTPGQSWRKNAANTMIEAYTPGTTTPVNTNTVSNVTIPINQVAHGLTAGNVVRLNGGSYVQAKADSALHAEVVGIASSVTDANNFVLQMGGMVTTGLAGLVAGSVYYLDPAVAGGLTAVRPTTATQVVKPLLVAAGAASGIWLNLLGNVL